MADSRPPNPEKASLLFLEHTAREVSHAEFRPHHSCSTDTPHGATRRSGPTRQRPCGAPNKAGSGKLSVVWWAQRNLTDAVVKCHQHNKMAGGLSHRREEHRKPVLSRGAEPLGGSPTRQLLPKNLGDSLGKTLWWFPVKKENGGGGEAET